MAYDRKRGIGVRGRLPWNFPEELKWVSQVTRSVIAAGNINAVIMGRHTWDSIPPSVRPLKGRLNIVVSKTLSPSTEAEPFVFSDFVAALEYVRGASNVESVFIFGGESIYRQALDAAVVDEVLATEVDLACDADTFFPPIPERFRLRSETRLSIGGVAISRKVFVNTGETPDSRGEAK